MVHEFNKPIPVIAKDEHGRNINGYAIYMETGGQFENDIWTVCLCEGGVLRTYTIDQLRVYQNATYDIKKE